MNAVIKLLLSKGIKLIASRGGEGGGGRPPEKAVTEMLVLGFSVVNSCLSIRLWEVTSVRQRFL